MVNSLVTEIGKTASALKGAKTIRLFVLQIPWQRKLERSDEFKSSNKWVRPLFLPGRRKNVRKSSAAFLFLSRCPYLVHNHQHHFCSFHCRLERATRIRQFRVAIIELTFRNVTLARAEEMEMQWFGAKNVVVGRETGQDQGRPEQQNTERLNAN